MPTKNVARKNTGVGKRDQSCVKIFDCQEAESRFNESVSKRTFCLEKGFILQDNDKWDTLPLCILSSLCITGNNFVFILMKYVFLLFENFMLI